MMAQENVFAARAPVHRMSKSPALVLCTVGMLFVLSALPVATAQNGDAETPASITRIMMLPPEAEVTGMLVDDNGHFFVNAMHPDPDHYLSLIHISEPTRHAQISYAVFCLKKKKK